MKKLNGRNILVKAGIVVIAGIVGVSAEAAGEISEMKGREQYPGKNVPKMLEAYEISEYGRPPIEEDFELLMGD